MTDFLFEYAHEDGEYGFTIQAETADEARAKLVAMSKAKLLGEVVEKIPAKRGWTPRLVEASTNNKPL